LQIEAAPDTLESLRVETDETVCIETHEDFGAIGFFYTAFRQIGDEEVIAILDRLGADRASPAGRNA
jgi:predicted phosphoribosyltransferase